MPKTLTLNYVHELPWKATCRGTVKIDNLLYTRAEIGAWEIEKVHRINGVVVFFSKECQAKLLDAMDNYGKAEEPERWKSTAVWAKGSGGYAVEIHSKCLLELRSGLEKLEAKLEELSKK